MLPETPPERPKLNQRRLRELLETARMDATEGITAAIATERRFERVLAITGEIWAGVFGEEAPEVTLEARMRAS
jgi:hypothetical protein